MDDLEEMTVGMCLDFIDDYVDRNDPEKIKKRKNKPKRATQADIDAFTHHGKIGAG